ncbi:MAG: xanthine dehydrogenase small subunit [Hyphomicrobiales bacterium]|nr:xanthine dehydrogenase small subunit [Hyphomicrobiales bacterium]
MAESVVGLDTRRDLTFRFRGETISLDRFSPRATLLDWLREEAGAKGTKEGCGEGDCGACTVVLSRLRDGALTYEPVNACILLLGQVDGAEVLTIEDLAEGETLHPVQQAMVDFHGSQCGFCTPGIVMSLFALYHQDAPATYGGVCEALAGNLCRCTGYKPIIDAALTTCVGQPADRFELQAAARSEAIAALADGRDLFVGDENAFFAAPASEAALAELTARFPDAILLGGATDVGLWITKQLRDPKRIIWLGRVAGLDVIRSEPHGVRFGATATLKQSTEHLAALHPDLGPLMARFGSRQVRESGTIGGNIANGSPIGDLAPALIALGARVELRKGGAARVVPLEDFFIAYGKQDRAPGEYVSALLAPRLGEAHAYRAVKISKRFDEDISAVMGAVRLTVDGDRIAEARLAFGGMAATPKRASRAEKALLGARLSDRASWQAALDALAEDFTPLTDMRATAAYRSKVAANLVAKALMEIAGAAAPTRIGEYLAAQ